MRDVLGVLFFVLVRPVTFDVCPLNCILHVTTYWLYVTSLLIHVHTLVLVAHRLDRRTYSSTEQPTVVVVCLAWGIFSSF